MNNLLDVFLAYVGKCNIHEEVMQFRELGYHLTKFRSNNDLAEETN